MITTRDKEERVNYILEQNIKDLDVNYRISNDYFKAVSDNAYHHLIKNNPDILELLYLAKQHAGDSKELQKIRAKLYSRLQPHYEQLIHSGVIITLFSFENNHTLLRLHKPNKFGDNLSKIRYSFTYVNEHKKTIRGFEQGKISHAFRNVFPIFYRHEYLGSVDIAFSSESLQEGMTKAHQIDTHFILNKNLFKANIWKAQKKVKYVQSIEHDDFLFALTPTHNEKELDHGRKLLTPEITNNIKKNIPHGKAFSLYSKVGDTIKVITFSPIKNIKENKTVAYLVSYTDSPYLKSILNDYFWINSSAVIGMLILIMLICNIVRHRFFLQEEVDKKTQELKTLNENLQHDIQRQLSEIREKDGLLLEQARLASMGEMIGNIAHQWRQPLNALGLILQKIPMLHQRNKLDEETLNTTVDKGMSLVNQMSSTIDDFRFFFQENKDSETFKLIETVDNCYALLSPILEQDTIEFKSIIDENILIHGHSNQLSQVLLNIMNNAKDALNENSVDNPIITVLGYCHDNKIAIDILDNAGGIPEDIIKKIFDPYFTTKEEGKGTGIGLFMSKRIIEENMKGSLQIFNTEAGAKFTIILPQGCTL
ncbi:sensor histidine kinase [Campylobacterota bacterium]